MNKIPLSVLELATVVEGGNMRSAIERTVEVAQHTESLGYKRIWLAEHHNNNMSTTNEFPKDIKQLQTYFSKENSTSSVRAFPGEGLDIPLWILGSSTDSAYLAAQMGLPYAFAAHFAPAQFRKAIDIYRHHFRSSKQLKLPYVMACINVIDAETDVIENNLLIVFNFAILTNIKMVGVIKSLLPHRWFPTPMVALIMKNPLRNVQLVKPFWGPKPPKG